MNARGKLLTAFENYKASLQRHIIFEKWEKNKSYIDLFTTKIDTKWTDYFWTHFKRDNSIDDAYMRFISTIIMIRISIERDNYKPDQRNLILKELQDNPNNIKPEYLSKEGFKYLYECFEIYTSVDKGYDLSLKFPLWRHQPKKSILFEIVYEINEYATSTLNSASYSLKVLYYAQTEYLRKVKKFEQKYFLDWMRVIRNIISRGDIEREGKRPDIIRSPQSFDGVIQLINELSEGCENIYKYLYLIGSIKSTFAKDQIDEEKTKAKLINTDPSIKELIFYCEDNDLLRGRIEFIFYTIGYNKTKTINKIMLKKVGEIFNKYFDRESEVTGDLRRAMMTIEVNGEYEFYNYWWSLWNVINVTKRRLFDNYRELEYFIYSDQKEYFKKLVLKLCEKNLKTIVEDFNPPSTMPNWKIRLIKEPKLLDEISKSNYIAIPDDNSYCYLLKSKRPRDTEGCYKVE